MTFCPSFNRFVCKLQLLLSVDPKWMKVIALPVVLWINGGFWEKVPKVTKVKIVQKCPKKNSRKPLKNKDSSWKTNLQQDKKLKLESMGMKKVKTPVEILIWLKHAMSDSSLFARSYQKLNPSFIPGRSESGGVPFSHF